MAWNDIGEKVAIGVISAVALGALALIWNFASQGGLIRALGGVPEGDLSPQLALLHEKMEAAATKQELKGLTEQLVQENQSVPSGAVVAFDIPGECPEGWKQVSPEWKGRTIVSAARNAIDSYGYRKTGGAEKVALVASDLPSHTHRMSFLRLGPDNKSDFRQEYYPLAKGTDFELELVEQFRRTEAEEQKVEATPHNNMPPFIALYFCTKE